MEKLIYFMFGMLVGYYIMNVVQRVGVTLILKLFTDENPELKKEIKKTFKERLDEKVKENRKSMQPDF